MKKVLAIMLAALTVVSFSACGKNGESGSDMTAATAIPTPAMIYAYDGAKIQEVYPEMAARIVEDSTRVKFTVGDKVLYGCIDNEVEPAVQFLSMLPMTVHMERTESCLGGKIDNEILYDSKLVHYGWLNGDIDYYAPEQSIKICFSNQDFSNEENGHINFGSVIGNLSDWYDFSGEYDVLIEAAPVE